MRDEFFSPHKHIKNKTTCKTTLTEIYLKTSRTSLPQPSLCIKVHVESGRQRGERTPLVRNPEGDTVVLKCSLGVRGLPHIRYPNPEFNTGKISPLADLKEPVETQTQLLKSTHVDLLTLGHNMEAADKQPKPLTDLP